MGGEMERGWLEGLIKEEKARLGEGALGEQGSWMEEVKSNKVSCKINTHSFRIYSQKKKKKLLGWNDLMCNISMLPIKVG